VTPQITPFPTGRNMCALYQAFHAWPPSFRPSGTTVGFLRLTQMGSCGTMMFSALRRLHDSLLTSPKRSTAANPSETPMASFAVKQRVHSLLAPFTLVCVLLVCAFGAHAQSPASSQNTPQATLTALYHWYLEELARSRDPLHDDRAKIDADFDLT
jgi:hypothetical protein